MAFIGSPSLFVGGSWFIGSWAGVASGTDSVYPGLSEGDLWVYKDSTDQVITQLEFGTSVLPGNSLQANVKIQYRGYRPIKVYGFYVKAFESPFYDGDKTPEVDSSTMIKWADDFTLAAPLAVGNPGLEITQVHWNTGLPETTQFVSGAGDVEDNAIPYVGHESYLTRDDQMLVNFRITAPSAALRQVIEAGRFHFGIDISFLEVPINLVDPGAGC
jgi:hypothetical protein